MRLNKIFMIILMAVKYSESCRIYYTVKKLGGEVGEVCMGQRIFIFMVRILFPSTDCMFPGNGPLYFLNSPHKQSVWYLSLSCSTATNSCSSPLPFLENLAPKQRKAKTENWWSRLAKAGCQEKGVFQKILHPQVPMLNYSDHNIPLVLVQFYCFCFIILCFIFYLLLKVKAQLLGSLST